jgi:hypothetical protein
MNWDAIGAIGEMIGAAAVFVSIIYLSIQIKENTRATRGSASFDATHSWAQTNEQLYQQPDATLANIRDWFQDQDRQSLSDLEQARMEILWRSIYQKLEGQYFLYKYGLLDAALWERRRGIGRGMIESAYPRVWWQNESKYNAFTQEFIQEIEGTKS